MQLLTKADIQQMSDGQRQILFEGVKMGRKQVTDFLKKKMINAVPSDKSLLHDLIEEISNGRV